jgi:hypothetical protein
VSRYDRTPRGHAETRALVGLRIHWPETPNLPRAGGTIVETSATRNGYPMLVVEWDPEVPDWYSPIVSPRSDVVVEGRPR